MKAGKSTLLPKPNWSQFPNEASVTINGCCHFPPLTSSRATHTAPSRPVGAPVTCKAGNKGLPRVGAPRQKGHGFPCQPDPTESPKLDAISKASGKASGIKEGFNKSYLFFSSSLMLYVISLFMQQVFIEYLLWILSRERKMELACCLKRVTTLIKQVCPIKIL